MVTPIPAAGTVPWRLRDDGEVEVALVHRPKYRDWSWAKGKLDADEHPCVAAFRETEEETGLVVRLGIPLPMSQYPLLDSAGVPATKQVHYWASEVTGGTGRLVHEVDAIAWLDATAAHHRLDYARDREQLRSLVRAHREGMLATWPLAVVRHAKAMPRGDWKGPDPKRPLTAAGRAQVPTITAILRAYGIERVTTSASTRCQETIAGYAARPDVRVKVKESLSEEAFAAHPHRAVRAVAKVLRKGAPAAICSHGPLLPTLIQVLSEHVRTDDERHGGVHEALRDAVDTRMAKGEVMVLHCVGRGEHVRIIDVERHVT